MMCEVALVVKLGGSAITKMDQQDTLDQEALSKAAELILQCHKKKLACIVVHSCGSFSRFPAQQYKVHKGSDDIVKDENVKKGFCLTKKAGAKLHHHVLDSLIAKGVPAVGISFSNWKIEDGKVIKYDLGSLSDHLQKGFVPVLHGFCALDSTRGCSIITGDTVIQTISESREFVLQKIVFLTSDKGVYNKPPGTNPDAKLLKKIVVNKQGKQQGEVIDTTTKSSDGTGGMSQKLAIAMDIVHKSQGKTEVFVCKIDSQYAVEACSEKKPENGDGTKLVFGA